jgi:hypothetical protein
MLRAIQFTMLASLIAVLSAASPAAALTDCAFGPWVSVPNYWGWGPASECNCGTTVAGGMYASNQTYAYGWANGATTRQVRLQILMVDPWDPQVQVVQNAIRNPGPSTGLFTVKGGSATEGAFYGGSANLIWAYVYRSVCSK